MFHAIVFSLLAAGCFYLAVAHQGWLWLLMWLSVSFGFVAFAYATANPRVFGKQPNGGIAGWALILLFPFFALTWSVWRLACLLSRENPMDELTPGVVVGRRLLPREIPANVKSIIDLTAEFPGTPASTSRSYLNCPILDGSAITAAQLVEVARQIAAMPEPIFIHCAQGHGRTGMIAATVLLHRELAGTPEEAIGKAQSCRPGIKLSKGQRQSVKAVARLLGASHD